MASVLDLMILWLEVDSVEDLADFGSAGANPADYSMNFPTDPILGPREIWHFRALELCETRCF